MKQIRKKIKMILHYLPNGYPDEKSKAFVFIKCNNQKVEYHLDQKGNKTDITLNELLNEIRSLLEKEIENE